MKGIVKYPNYKTGGVPQFKGMKNKRSFHNAKERRLEAMAAERRAELMESLEPEPSNYR